ncbi:MAG: PAS domain S-box protein [Caldilineaceae bacterium]|nr:PAS domain S-box protein [Caldilineaceae bacterium]
MYPWIERFDLRVSLSYGILATAWILISDYVVAWFTQGNEALFISLSQVKGIGFIAITAVALYGVLSAKLRKQSHLEQVLQEDILERKAAEAAEREQRLFAEAMRDSLAALTTSHNVNEVLRKLLDYAATVVTSEAGSILLFQQEMAHVAYLRGFTPEATTFFQGYHFPIESMVYQTARLNKQPYFVPNTKTADHWIALPATAWIHSSVGVPIELQGEVIGLLIADSAEPYHFQPKDVEKLQTFARYASLALQNAYHVRHLEAKVTERTAELQTEKERVEAILHNSLDGMLMLSPDLTIQQANPSFARMVASSSAAAEPLSLLAFIAAEEQEHVVAQINYTRQTHVGSQFEVRLLRRDGVSLETEFSLGHIKDADWLVCTIRDIAERKRAEEAIRTSEERYRQLVATMQGGLSTFNVHEEFTYVNDRLCELLGYTREEFLGHQPHEFVYTSEIDKLNQHIQRRHRAEIGTYEILAKRKDGQPIDLLIADAPLFDKQGNYTGSVAVTTDITAQKQAEATLRQALAKERELGNLKSRLVSMASHEFRTPLATILALTETISTYRQRMTEEQIEHRLHKIREQISHLEGIIDDVLLMTRMQAKRNEFNPTPVDLDSLCRESLSEFANQPDVAQRLIYRAEPSTRLLGLDAKLIRRIISHLLANAIKYSPPPKPILLQLRYSATDAILCVRDEGIGIPPADQEHLFEPFHRAANVGAIAGTGLGLVLTKEAVLLHHGMINIESQLGLGTTVMVSLPFSFSDASAPAIEPTM